MKHEFPVFTWTRFLVCFIAAPLLVTLLTFWAWVPVIALVLGGPLYLIVGIPVAAMYLRRHPPRVVPVMLLAQACQLLQLPFVVAFGWDARTGINLDMIGFFLSMGALFALLWTGTFVLLYRALPHDDDTPHRKEPSHV